MTPFENVNTNTAQPSAAEDIKTVYEDLLPLLQSTLGVDDSELNRQKLKDFGYKIIGPEIGDMACGEYGEGKMSDPLTIATEIDNYFLIQKNKPLT